MTSVLLVLTLIITVEVAQGASTDYHRVSDLDESLSDPKHLPQNVVEGFVAQNLDNFDPRNNAQWQQRYVINDEFYAPGGCIFLLLNGEWRMSADHLQNTMMYEMARQFHCYMASLEHRFFGDSHPTEDVSVENMKYLSVDQVLADIAHFVEHLKTDVVLPDARDAPVVVIGRRYAGSLAAWFRQSYPHLTVGAWSSSSPTQVVMDMLHFKELAGAVYRHVGGNECYNRIERGFAQMEQMVANGQLADLSEMFHICKTLRSPSDVQTFFLVTSDFYSSVTQFERAVDIGEACEILASNETLSDAEAVAFYRTYRLNGECIGVDYEMTIESNRQTNWNDTLSITGSRQFNYLRCTQLGWFPSSTSRFHPFGSSFPVEFLYRFCRDLFGDFLTPELMHRNEARFNTAYGGLNPRATNVLYIHGELDPMRTAGVQTADVNDATVTVIVIKGAAQSSDLYPISDADSDEVARTKETIKETVRSWVRGSERS